ncbi:MAG: hypothetical protein ACI3VR_02020 [Intestinibacter sp.]|uniref:hypothetical protein n=1 Tax=Intestinibacter sp. TaxID=1965304 RepID=UPI003F14D96F
MERIIKYGGKLFFGSLIICILSFFYFKLIPCGEVSNLIGYVFLEVFLGYNFYVGYRYELNFKEAFIVGILGSGFGIFLLFFASYTHYVIDEAYWSIWMMQFYFMPTMSFIADFSVDVSLGYVVFLIIFSTVLVVLGAGFRFLKKRIIYIKNKCNLSIYKDFL